MDAAIVHLLPEDGHRPLTPEERTGHRSGARRAAADGAATKGGGVVSKQPIRFVSGSLGNHTYEIDCLIPGGNAMVQVQLREDAAQRLIWWRRPEFAGMPFREVPELSDSDSLCDAVREAVEAWVATFPLIVDPTIPGVSDEDQVSTIESEIRELGWEPRIAPTYDAFTACVSGSALKSGHHVPAITPLPGSEAYYVRAAGETRLATATAILAEVQSRALPGRRAS